MVQAHEIKVGNRFIRELRNTRGLEYDHEFELTEYYMGQLFTDNGIGLALHDLFPIHLSPEILEACACTQGDDKEMWRHSSGVWLTKVHNKDEYFINGFRSGHTIKYLHQYQNAVFVMTGEELKVQVSDTTMPPEAHKPGQ